MPQIPNIDPNLLLRAFSSPGAGQVIQSGITGFEKGTDLASRLQEQRAKRRTQEMELMKEVQALQQKQAEETAVRTALPDAPAATFGDRQVPLRQVASVDPTTGQVLEEGPQIRERVHEQAKFKAFPKETIVAKQAQDLQKIKSEADTLSEQEKREFELRKAQMSVESREQIATLARQAQQARTKAQEQSAIAEAQRRLLKDFPGIEMQEPGKVRKFLSYMTMGLVSPEPASFLGEETARELFGGLQERREQFQPPQAPQMPAFASIEQAHQAAAQGRLQDGQRVTVGGRAGTYFRPRE